MRCGSAIDVLSGRDKHWKFPLRSWRHLLAWSGGLILLILLIEGAIWLGTRPVKFADRTAPGSHLNQKRSKSHTYKQSPTAKSSSSITESSIIASTMASVVEVEATNGSGEDLGSGFVFDQHGDILTNDHVVSGAISVTVKTETGQTYSATIIGADPTLDVAVLRVNGLNLAPLPVDATYQGSLGDNVLAFGSPLGLANTVTTGIISGLDRNFTIHGVNYQSMFQISAPIAPGNSGGPLVLASDGEVVGMDTAGVDTVSGNIGFAIPISRAYPSALIWAAHPEDNPNTLLPSSNPSPSPSPSQSSGPSSVPSSSSTAIPSVPPSPSSPPPPSPVPSS